MDSNKLTQMKIHHAEEMDMYSKNVREHVDRYGSNPCDYLSHQVTMPNYHRGCVNTLIKVIELNV